jgi:hypothetical protein
MSGSSTYHRYTITLEVVANPDDGLGDPNNADHWFGLFGGVLGDEIATVEAIKIKDHGEVDEE